MTTTHTRKTRTVEAADLRPGDWVLDEHGDVDHGVYDVHVGHLTRLVTVYTREMDQRLGWPTAYQVHPTTRYTISRVARR